MLLSENIYRTCRFIKQEDITIFSKKQTARAVAPTFVFVITKGWLIFLYITIQATREIVKDSIERSYFYVLSQCRVIDFCSHRDIISDAMFKNLRIRGISDTISCNTASEL